MMAGGFQPQQQFLGGKTSAVSRKRMVAADNTMARRKDGNSIGSVGIGHRTDSLRHVNHPGKLAIGNRLPVGDFQQFVPYLLLKVCTDKQ